MTARRRAGHTRGLVLAMAALFTLSACSGSDLLGGGGVSLKWAEDGANAGAFGMQQADLQPGKLVSFGAMTLCVDGGDSAEISGVHFKQAQHIEIQRYAVRAVPTPGLGGSDLSIAAEGFDPRERTVTSKCNVDDGVTELAADFVADAPGVAEGSDLIVSYASGDDTKSVTIPVTITLCSYPQDKCPH